MKTFEINSTIYVGQDSKENWELLKLDQNFWWFHLESFPSSHVVFCNSIITNTEIYQSANYCKEHSKYRNYKNVYVIYTQLKNVIKASKEGEVFSRKTLRIKI